MNHHTLLPPTWPDIVNRAKMNLQGTCPLSDDECIVEADRVIRELLESLESTIRVFVVSDDDWDVRGATERRLARALREAGVIE